MRRSVIMGNNKTFLDGEMERRQVWSIEQAQKKEFSVVTIPLKFSTQIYTLFST